MIPVTWMRIERASAAGRAQINGRRIYILPTRYGWIFAALIFLMLLGAVNYGNNPAHLLTFLLAGIGSNAIYLTWRNLRGLRVVCQGASPVFAGEQAQFLVELDKDERERPAIQLMFEDTEPELLDLRSGSGRHARKLGLNGMARGLHQPGRLVISTQYPLGLFRAWCYLECDRPILIYPMPGEHWTPVGGDGEDTLSGEYGTGNDDFMGLRGYQPGDQPSQIDWKSYARDRGLNTRVFSGQSTSPVWIDWDQAPGDNTERRISALARAVIDADAHGRAYGLRTPEGVVGPARGPAQRHQCLRHLALYGMDHA
ncbi:MAG: DUF58 domain-containing protein [Chromatiaceae bacterium]|nr:DUF58 domain-containing protein [Chromatiaceae bacterium]